MFPNHPNFFLPQRVGEALPPPRGASIHYHTPCFPPPPPSHANDPASAPLPRPPPRLHSPAAEAAPFNRRLRRGPVAPAAAASRARLPRPPPRPTPASSRPAAPPPDPRPRRHSRLTQKLNQLLLPSLSGFRAREGGEGEKGRNSRWVSVFPP